MSSTLQLGPLALPLQPLVLGAAAWAGVAAGRRLGRETGIDVERVLIHLLLAGLVAARLAFVWEWRSAYLRDPLSILDIRDGGWTAIAGLAAAGLYGLVLLARQPVLRRPVLVSAIMMLTLWTVGQLALLAAAAGGRETAPRLSLTELDGRPFALDAPAGKPTLVNLWATWCPPCRREMPLLAQAQAGHPEIRFVFVNQGESRATVERYLREQHLKLAHVVLDEAMATGAAFNQQALPTTLLFDTGGHLVSTRVGAFSDATLAQSLDALLRAPSSTAPPRASTPTATP